MSKKLLGLVPLMLAVALAGCVKDDESTTAAPNPNDASAVGFKARFNPAVGIAPFPNDIFISQTDGTLMPPASYDPTSAADASADFGDPMQAMSTLDGWSLNAAFSASFNDSIDADTAVGVIPTVQAGSVLVVDVTAAPAVLIPGVDYSVGLSPAQDSAQSILQITPLHPLEPEHTYAVVVTNALLSVTGNAAGADTAFQAIKDAFEAGTDLSDPTLESIKDGYAPLLAAVTAPLPAGFGIALDDIVILWTVTTQSSGLVLTEVVAQANTSAGEPAAVTAYVGTTNDLAGTGGTTEVYAGMIQLPYYSDAASPLTGFWTGAQGSFLTKFNPSPVATGTITVPFLITVPDGGALNGVVIFQHGITQNRTNVLAVADTLAAAGKAAIAIDLPLHGITDTTSGIYAPADGSNPLYPAVIGQVTEAHFYLDVLNNSTGASGGDGTIDGSGQSFINLTSLLTSRDNLRQAVSNLTYLAETVPVISFNGTTQGGSAFTFAGAGISFVGHSLGGIVGGTFLGVYADVGPATLGMPGGNIAQLLQDSPTIGAEVKAGLAANGVIEGTQLYYDFFRNAQTVVDAGDPINYGVEAAANSPIHMIEVVGGAGVPPDQVVPNSATEALANAMGLACVDSTVAGGGIVHFSAGDHSSLLDPSTSLSATTEMQTEMATFIATLGANLVITDGTVIAACP